ncbi:hypothetical protein CMO88_02025 [Candidatus Woesearchaeota archaeon]|nr:hypothetical protein [Candidatus Woesearchaeota archaeon]|tara:strand:+ start:7513 stop:7980 length:468 start_codon:yes stop_codon:yes gene_type:complete
MVSVEGPDGHNYNINFSRNKELELVLEECTGRKIEIFEGLFLWIRRRKIMGGYEIHLADGWKSFSTAVRGGFFVGHVAYLNSNMPIEEKLAIAFHELAHIIEGHPEGQDLVTEKAATTLAIKLVSDSASHLTKVNIREVVFALEQRQQIYEQQAL